MKAGRERAEEVMTMSGSVTVDIVVPVVGLLALLVLIVPVMWASRASVRERQRPAVTEGRQRWHLPRRSAPADAPPGCCATGGTGPGRPERRRGPAWPSEPGTGPNG